MANVIRIRRRLTGATGAPTGLYNAELAFNEMDDTLYYGKGTGGAGGTATGAVVVGGIGAFVSLTGAQTISGAKTWTGANDFTASAMTVATQAAGDNSTKPASTAWVRTYAQPANANVTAIAAVATNGALTRTGAGTYAARTMTTASAARIAISNGDGAAGNPTFDLASGVIGTPGTYSKVTVDTYGRITAGADLTSGDVIGFLGYTPQNIAQKGVANGYASLGADGIVPSSQLPAAVTGSMNYVGTWNASTNTPALVSGVGTKGSFYKVSVAGNTVIDGYGNWTVGDIIAFDGTTWDKFEGGNPDVVSVAGRIGAIVLTTADIGGLGTMATQNSNAVAITGGTIDGVTLDGGVF